MAEYLGMVLRSTGKVKRGLGTIRQDVNISIAQGARVEIKGVQELDLIAEVVRREVQRQQSLLAIRDELRKRGASVDATAGVEVTALFKETKSTVLKKAKKIHAIVLKGFAGLVGREIQPERRLGSEMSDYAKKCGVGGIFHTDELPAYGVTDRRGRPSPRPHACRGTGLCHPRRRCKREAGSMCHQPGDNPGKTGALGQTGAGRDPEDAREREHGLHAPAAGGSPDVPGDRCPARSLSTMPGGMQSSFPNFSPQRQSGLLRPTESRGIMRSSWRASEKLPLFEQAVQGRDQTQTRGISRSSPRQQNSAVMVWICRRFRIRHISTPGMQSIPVRRHGRQSPRSSGVLPGGAPLPKHLQKLAPAVSREELEKIVRKIIAERGDFVAQKGKGSHSDRSWVS